VLPCRLGCHFTRSCGLFFPPFPKRIDVSSPTAFFQIVSRFFQILTPAFSRRSPFQLWRSGRIFSERFAGFFFFSKLSFLTPIILPSPKTRVQSSFLFFQSSITSQSFPFWLSAFTPCRKTLPAEAVSHFVFQFYPPPFCLFFACWPILVDVPSGIRCGFPAFLILPFLRARCRRFISFLLGSFILPHRPSLQKLAFRGAPPHGSKSWVMSTRRFVNCFFFFPKKPLLSLYLSPNRRWTVEFSLRKIWDYPTFSLS